MAVCVISLRTIILFGSGRAGKPAEEEKDGWVTYSLINRPGVAGAVL